MKKCLRASLLILFVTANLHTSVNADEDVLKRVEPLQKSARLAAGGAKGCGTGKLTLITSKGRVVANSGLDPIHVFGPTIKVSDLLILLKSRAESNRSGKKGPMSGDVSSLCYVCFSALSLSKDKEAIPVVADLMKDEDDAIRGGATIALYTLWKSSPDLQKPIESLKFPQKALASARERGQKPPSWVKTER